MAARVKAPPEVGEYFRNVFREDRGSAYIVESIDIEYKRFWQDEFTTGLLGGDIGRRIPVRGSYIHVMNDYLPILTRFNNGQVTTAGTGLIFWLAFVNLSANTPFNKIIPLYGRQLIYVPEEFNEAFVVGTLASNPGTAPAVFYRPLSTPLELMLSKTLKQEFNNSVVDSRFDLCYQTAIPASVQTQTVIFPMPLKGIAPEVNILIPDSPVNAVSFTIRQTEPATGNELPIEFTINPVAFPYQETFQLYPYRRTSQVIVRYVYGGAAEDGIIFTTMGYKP
jgi:hypothetical protein